MTVYKNLSVIGLQQAIGKETNSSLTTFTEQINLQFLTYHIFFTQHHKICCTVKYFPKRLSYQFLAFNDLYI